ncbi:hypothetical protein AAG742_04365 [Micrococcus sp. 2A]|uniref:hypothetical protein n=1 Tax=Micrococcus sp. 2A TaxID=3142261 RepID=UPI002604D1E5|nr:hypothetical protein [uncultured Micrococcus sp.]
MTARTARPRRRWENRAGWWGILWWSVGGAGAALALTALAFLTLSGPGGVPSVLTGGGIVLALSAVTGATTALAWDHAREAVLPVSIGMFVVKIAVFGILAGMAPRPGWLEATPAAVAALVVIVAWQAAEVLVFARTRRSIYAD